MQEEIYKLTLDQLYNSALFQDMIENEKINYYWSDEWNPTFYIHLAKLGFISTSYETFNGLVLLPELQFEYGILDFKDLRIHPKVRQLIQQDTYKLTFNHHFYDILDNIAAHHHKNNWLKDEYRLLLEKIYTQQNQHTDFKLYSVELISKLDNTLVAGEIGYSIGSTYTSLTGFSSREKRYNNCGKLQLVLLAQYLEKKGFAFWNLGHPHMQYKKQLGSKIYSRKSFLQRWQEAIQHHISKDLNE